MKQKQQLPKVEKHLASTASSSSSTLVTSVFPNCLTFISCFAFSRGWVGVCLFVCLFLLGLNSPPPSFYMQMVIRDKKDPKRTQVEEIPYLSQVQNVEIIFFLQYIFHIQSFFTELLYNELPYEFQLSIRLQLPIVLQQSPAQLTQMSIKAIQKLAFFKTLSSRQNTKMVSFFFQDRK